MSTTHRPAENRERSLKSILPRLNRAPIDVSLVQLRTAGGSEITEALRDELLAKCQAGQYVELDMTLLAFEQRPGVANRNYVRFRDGAMLKLGSSGKGRPFLRDHAQESVEARGGTIIRSQTEKRGEGDYAINMTVRLTAPWAVDLALRGLLGSVSIGWHSSAPIECSVCGTAVYTECYHWPGDTVSEQEADGKKRYVRDRKGSLVVEWVFTDADLTECSAVNVPAVPGAGIDGFRAALSAAFPSDREGDGLTPHPPQEPAPEDATSAPEETSPSAEPEDTMSEKTAVTEDKTGPTEAEIDDRVEAKLKQRRSDEKTLSGYIAKRGLTLDAGDLLDKHKSLDKAKLALLDAMVSADPVIDPTKASVTMGAESSDKKRDLIEKALLVKMSNGKSSDVDVTRYSRMSLMAIGDELFEDAGVSSRSLRDISPQERAKLMLGMRLPIGVSRKLAGPGMNSTSDFPLIIGNVMQTRMRALYERRQQAWKQFAYKENLNDFSSVPSYAGGRFPKLLPVDEGGTYQRGSFQMSSMDVQLEKAGRIVSITWELILADRIGLIDRAISDRVNAALRWEDTLFYRRLISNLMADGLTAIYDTPNTGTSGAISVATLSSGYVKMATREDPDGDDPVEAPDEDGIVVSAVNARPRFWYTPVTQEINAEALLGDGYQPTASTGAPTSAMKSLTVIGDGNLDANGITATYLFADPSEAVTVQYGHLASEDGPVLEEEMGFTVDGKDYKVRATGYVEFVDNIGTVKLPA